ncbi:serine/threonine-protein kinase [Cronbergia sp. UHCC 0137]|uniref:serine/threonine protein kinase n=1 Tax=Cronbergia sp. UHCC 0137 TaxID=3110239 RepID=UPI002B1EA90C|nr:serine/threonine-protein kinase [Cronbergia sp. UHCC 0137]MEA5619113.1 serine/threonine-protein kinase [Cronbergia sp. UHCC 0137]
MSDPNLRRLLSNRYEIQDLIGTGAMGRVYRAKDIVLGGVPVAIKFLSLSIENEKMRLQERFEREAKTCALLGQKSIHIVRVMDYGVDENKTPYYVMEYLQGQGLNTIIRRQHIPLTRFLSMTRQICLGLKCAHDGIAVDGKTYPIIHRDIKPSNMLVIQDSSFGELVKVLDFGIAKLLMTNSDNTKFYLGTLAYSSPEQIEGKELDSRSDIYSLGVMMFEMLTGKMPLLASTQSFGAWYKLHKSQQPRSLMEVNPTLEIPQEIHQLVMRCLAKKPSDRPQNIGEIIEILKSVESPQDQTPPINLDLTLPNPTPKTQTKPEEISYSNLSTILIPEEKPNPKPLVSQNNNNLAEKKVTPDLLPPTIKTTQLTSWPANKPIANIVFPQAINYNDQILAALWVMLPQAEIEKRLICTRYNQFLFISTPHPMLLWITVIYNRQHGAKWLPYYLDLKTNFGQQIIRLLQQTDHYQLFFFARENPSHCSHILSASIASTQNQRFQEWLLTSNLIPSSGNASMSKSLLKKEYEKIKPQILEKLETTEIDISSNFF